MILPHLSVICYALVLVWTFKISFKFFVYRSVFQMSLESKLSLQNATSEKVRGNHTSHHSGSHHMSPITISTYYFIHAPNAEDQPNLLSSHSAPAHMTQTSVLQNVASGHDSFPRKISEDTDEDVVDMQLPEMQLPEFNRNGTLSPGNVHFLQQHVRLRIQNKQHRLHLE